MQSNKEKIVMSLTFLIEQINFSTSELVNNQDITNEQAFRLFKKIKQLANEFDLLFSNIDELRTFYLDSVEKIFIKGNDK